MNDVSAYCVLDIKAKIYNQPHFLINDAVAIRQFQIVIGDTTSMLSKYPEDYRLYRVASFNMETGIITPEAAPVEIANGINFKKE